MRIDLGCGTNKHPGYFGIDRLELPGVDLVCDINEPIPLPDDSVEFVMASRSLPYVEDIMQVLADLYRMCMHKAVMCILAPYAHHYNHIVNPHLKQKFDESSPIYWTPHFYEPTLGPRCPKPTSYARYDNSTTPAFDFRLLRMELQYQPPFVPPLYELEELEMLQRIQPNVVDEILYYVVAVKQPVTERELEWMSRQTYPLPSVLRSPSTLGIEESLG